MARPSRVSALPRILLVAAGIVLAFAAAGGPPAARATTLADVYTVTGVPVDATAANAQQARDQALAAGQSRAARLLLERLALRSDHPRLPRINADTLTRLVSGFQVADERNSTVRYLANLTVTFNPEAVRTLMREAGIQIAETPSQPVLVLPVWRSGNAVQLFDDRNPWRAAWLKVAAGKGLVPLLTPLGDIGDLQAITAEQALAGDQAALAAIAQRYGTAAVIVAFATGSSDETVDQLIVTRYPLGGGQGQRIAVTPRRPPEALLATAMAVSQEVEEGWKSATAIDSAMTGALDVTAPVQQLGEWVAMRKRLTTVPLVKRVDVRAMGVGAVQLTLHHAGTVPQLRAALAQSDLALSDENGALILRSIGAAATPPAPRQP